MPETDNESRLVAMETALAHLEAQVQDLSDVIARQWDVIDRLGKRLDRAEALIGQHLAGMEDTGGEDQKPE